MLRQAIPLVAVLCLASGSAAQSTGAERLLGRLSLEQRAAQLLMSWTRSELDPDSAATAHLRELVEDVGLGGVVLSLGTKAGARALVADLQGRAAIPLLVAADFENGPGFRLSDGIDFGPQMLLGASGSAPLAYRAGAATGREARALGVHQVFAPVLDVQVDPANPIIQVRAFGEDPAEVARLGVAWTYGLQAEGVVATGKHFPGHGDVSTDSHVTLPVVPGDRARLDAVELVPFRAAIDAGIASLMTAHLSVAGLGEDPSVPATLSRRIMTDVLRNELGFDGLLVTDALTMGGLAGTGEVDAALQALAAGADLLLMAPDPLATRDAIVAAVRAGTLPAERLDEACLRILRLKERVGLLAALGLPVSLPRAAEDAHLALADEIAGRGVTLARDPGGVVPLGTDEPPPALTLVAVDAIGVGRPGEALATALRSRVAELDLQTIGKSAGEGALDAARALLESAAERKRPTVLALFHGRSGRVPEFFASLAEATGPRGVVVLCGNPFVVPPLPDAAAVLLGYGVTPAIERAVAAALLGDHRIVGRAPVTVPGLVARGGGLTAGGAPGALGRSAAIDEGFAPDLEQRIRSRLAAAINAGVFPGAVAVVARHGQVVASVALGRETYADDAPPIREDSLFDLASLTKVCATTPAVLRLVDTGRVELDTPVTTLVPAFDGGDKPKVTLRHLLTHSSGLPAYARFHAELAGRDAIVAAAAATALEAAPGTRERYSDIGMILAMACVEAAAGEPFENFVQREVFDRLGMSSATFATSGSPIDAVPTEVAASRGGLVRGEVHDENAHAMGGISGHAGMFADAFDVTRLGQAFLAAGRGLSSPALARAFVTRQGLVEGSSRAIGWDSFTPAGSGGSKLSASAFGHTGFTGTSIWCDPALDLSIVLLSNRVHPTREQNGHVAVRRELADLVVDALDG